MFSTFYHSLLDLIPEVILKSSGSVWISVVFLVMSCEFSDSGHPGNPIKTKDQKKKSMVFASLGSTCACT